MPGIRELNNVWNNIKEIDLRPIAEAAQRPVHLALVGRHTASLSALGDSLRRDLARPDQVTHTPLLLASPDEIAAAPKADLAILLIDQAAGDLVKERALAQSWSNSSVPVLVILLPTPIDGGEVIPPRSLTPGFPASRIIAGAMFSLAATSCIMSVTAPMRAYSSCVTTL